MCLQLVCGFVEGLLVTRFAGQLVGIHVECVFWVVWWYILFGCDLWKYWWCGVMTLLFFGCRLRVLDYVWSFYCVMSGWVWVVW